MNTEQRMTEMRSRLQSIFDPLQLELLDEGHLHVGHAGAKDGRGHFRLIIVSEKFAGKNMIQRHRMVYQAMGDLMETDIHALTIDARIP
jgi:BolA protein